MFIDKLKRLVNPALADSLLAHSATEGTGVIPLDDLPKLLNAGNLKMPDSDETIAEHYRSFSNRNLLDNWYFPMAVNQRGKDTYSAKGETAIYSIDRFLVGRANLSVNEDGISLAWDGVTENNGYLQQRVPFPNLGGNTFTFSVLTADNHLISRVIEVGTKIGTNYGEFVFEHHIMLVIGNSNNNYAWCAIYSDTTTPTTLIAAKLELGRHQTLAHREGNKWVLNDPPPNYALELLKCQRYFYKSPSAFEYRGIAINNWYVNNGTIELPVPMRIKPVCKIFDRNGNAGKISLRNKEETVNGSATAMSNRIVLAYATNSNFVTGTEYDFAIEADANL